MTVNYASLVEALIQRAGLTPQPAELKRLVREYPGLAAGLAALEDVAVEAGTDPALQFNAE